MYVNKIYKKPRLCLNAQNWKKIKKLILLNAGGYYEHTCSEINQNNSELKSGAFLVV